MKRRKVMVALLILGIAGAMAAFELYNAEIKKPAGALSQLVDTNNKPVDFKSFNGKVVFVNNWASWCPPCVAEMPSIQELKNKLQTADIVFVMVSFDEDQNKALAFMKKRGFDFAVYFPGQAYPYATSSIPATFIIDKKGNVAAEHMGMADYSNDEIVNQLKSLAK